MGAGLGILITFCPRTKSGDVVEEASVAMGIVIRTSSPIVTRPYEEMKVQQLKEEARGRGLEVRKIWFRLRAMPWDKIEHRVGGMGKCIITGGDIWFRRITHTHRGAPHR